MILLGILLHFSASGCYDMNFSLRSMASSDRRRGKRGALRQSSCTHSSPQLPCPRELRTCVPTMLLSHGPLHKVNIRRCFLGQGVSGGPICISGAGVTPSHPPQLSRQARPWLHLVLAVVLWSVNADQGQVEARHRVDLLVRLTSYPQPRAGQIAPQPVLLSWQFLL